MLAKTKLACIEKLKKLQSDHSEAEPDKLKSNMRFGDWMNYWYENHSKLIQLDVTKHRQNVQSDAPLITVPCTFSNAWFAVVVIPELQPFTKCHFGIDMIGAQFAILLHRIFEFLFALGFCLRKHTFCDGIAILFVADNIASLISAIRFFDYTACSA